MVPGASSSIRRRHPYEFPPLPASIEFVMRALGMDTIGKMDDIEAIGLLVITAVSMIVCKRAGIPS